MRVPLRMLTLMLTIFVFAQVTTAQLSDMVVGKIDFPDRTWGLQTLAFEVTNNSDWLRFLTVEAEVSFDDSYVNPKRVQYTHFIMEPNMVRVCRPTVEIPGNYGRVTLNLRIYDVVDTLDDLSIGNQVFEQNFRLTFHPPNEVNQYIQEKVNLPPLVGGNPPFDCEFARLLFIWLNEGKSVDNIAGVSGADTTYVNFMLDRFITHGLVKREEETCTLVPPVIMLAEAGEGRVLAEKHASNLAALITGNMKKLDVAVDSMVKADLLNPDTGNFMAGGNVLYQSYPLITGLLLWHNLGQQFITGPMTLDVFRKTSPCRPNIGEFMYAVQGGDFFCGSHYYNVSSTTQGMETYFGDEIPTVTCKQESRRKIRLREKIDWSYDKKYHAESFFIDTALVYPGLRILADGATNLMGNALQDLSNLNDKYEHAEFTAGTRYWFWNLVATLTTRRLIENGTIERRGNGQYRFFRMRK